VVLCEDQRQGHATVFAVTVKGEPVAVNVVLCYLDGEQTYRAAGGEVPKASALRQAVFELPGSMARELKVWTHQITPDGQSERLPTVVDLACGGEPPRTYDLRVAGEQVLAPLTGGACRVQISLAR
jgi:hypothetical protein